MAARRKTGEQSAEQQAVGPELEPGAIAAALYRTATPMNCPPNWQPLDNTDERLRCYSGSDGYTSFFGHGLLSASAATGS